ncbi:MAG: hypothetical protein RLZZ252_628 [Bacteroidota bacterium]
MIEQLALLRALRLALDNFENNEQWQSKIHLASIKNRWFEPESIHQSLKQWQESLSDESIMEFLGNYTWNGLSHENVSPRIPILGLILAGNIPLVGLQDVINGVLCGYQLKVKRSSDDEVLITYLIEKAAAIEPLWSQRVVWSDDLKGIDAAIATGSNNSSRYFEYYFRDIPHIIRKNRNSVAIITGDESDDEILALGEDIFNYFGLGCRNVTHIILPENYDLGRIFRKWDEVYLNTIVNHNKYVNNYHYHKALLLMNLDPHVDTGYVIAKESELLYAPVGMLHFSYYQNLNQIIDKINGWDTNIQVVATNSAEIVTALGSNNISMVRLGKTQCTTLKDFADNVDTIQWLLDNRRLKTSQ